MLIKFLQRLADAGSVTEVRQTYIEAMAAGGFQHAFYAARFMLFLPPTVLREEIVTFDSFPPAISEELLAQDLLTDTPWAEWARRNGGSASTRDLVREGGGGPALDLALRHGVAAGRVISFKGKVLRGHGAVVLNPHAGASHDEADRRWQDKGAEITVLSHVMHMRMATIHRCRQPDRLTGRQRQVLEWSAGGKTVGEIATILGVTPATVEKHLRLARETLGATSTAQAILKAHLTNQLFMQDSAERESR